MNGARCLNVQSYRDGFLATLKNQNETNLIYYDVKKMAYRTLTNKPTEDDEHLFWSYFQDSFFQITPETGQIKLLDKQFKTLKTIRTAQYPVEKRKKTRSKYIKVLYSPFITDQMSYKFTKVRDQFGNLLPESSTLSLHLDMDGISEKPFSVVGNNAGNLLIFNWEDMEFAVIKSNR